jgi:hypothetical protein
MRVKAVEGRRIKHPATGRVIGPEGVDATGWEMFFHRCVNDGDLEIVKETPSPDAEHES